MKSKQTVPVIRNGSFWSVNIGHVGIVLIWAASFFVAWGAFSQKFQTFAENQIKLSDKVEAMDQHGTQASQKGIMADDLTLKSHEARIQKTEDAIADIKVMKEKIDNISDAVRELKDRHQK